LDDLEHKVIHNNIDGRRILILFYSDLVSRWRVDRHTTSHYLTEEELYLVEHVNRLALSGLSADVGASLLPSAIITFYESLVLGDEDLIHQPGAVQFPPCELVYLLVMSSSLADVSRLCALLGRCKQAFDLLNDYGLAVTTYYDSATTERFDSHLIDICNLFFRNQALKTSNANALGCLCSRKVAEELQLFLSQVDRDYRIEYTFSGSYGHLLCAMAITAFRAREESEAKEGVMVNAYHAGPVTKESLGRLERRGGIQISWMLYRLTVLNALKDKGLGGIKDLMFAAITGLKENPV
jgi:centromere protein I